jgi:hypothetical protein
MAFSNNCPAMRIASICTMSPCCPTFVAAPLWERLGFRPVTADAELRPKLASYGDSATYMLRDLAATCGGGR